MSKQQVFKSKSIHHFLFSHNNFHVFHWRILYKWKIINTIQRKPLSVCISAHEYVHTAHATNFDINSKCLYFIVIFNHTRRILLYTLVNISLSCVSYAQMHRICCIIQSIQFNLLLDRRTWQVLPIVLYYKVHFDQMVKKQSNFRWPML